MTHADPARPAGFDTNAIHAGYEPDQAMGSINVPIYASTTFAQNAPNDLRGGYEYARVANPTVDSLARTIAALEGAKYGRVYASGMAATDHLLRALLRPGDHLIMGHDAYGGTYRLIASVFAEWGVEFSVVDTTDAAAVGKAVRDNTKLVWVETPTNPLLAVTDIAAVAEVLREGRAGGAGGGAGEAGAGGVKLIVDNTFSSPYLQQPLSLGADIVLHSTTKYIGGHSDVVGGAIVSNDAELDEQLDFLLGGAGPIASPFDAYLNARGVKTLGVRMDRHCSNAQAVAEFLDAQPQVKHVLYPGLPGHPGHEVAAKQSTGKGFGGMISVRFADREAALAFCQSTELICLAESLGGVESLLEHPATMTHQSVAGSQLEVPDDLVRISVGIEDYEDIEADVRQALAKL
ncbi:MAG TPA: cystathionine gamma-synthase [Candidatus Corynebacterium gallistercoris]|uniref:Cystathionine gamma-synthase n=1 Tax=Candidatus Corynebacterium gallistercoris TaxID=2838530 RepID=A0A9D1UPZ0_9CORY|nr:cystathionine gamma-synthase [Candidatus Corynebacterium gallistercoris]